METSLEKLLHNLTYHPKDRMRLFRTLQLSRRSAIFNELSPRIRQEILQQLSLGEAVELLDHLDLQRAHYILGRMKNERRRKLITTLLKNDLHAKVEHFTSFHPQASASLVHLNYVLIPETTTISETATIIEKHLHNTGKIPEILVSRDGKLVGEVSLGTLVREANSQTLLQYITHLETVPYTALPQKAVRLLTKIPHKKIILLDNDESVLGIMYSDDVIDIVGRSPAASLYSFAGVVENERPFDSVRSKVAHRYKWLIFNLVTAFFAAGVVFLFEDTLAQVILLAIYMPIVAGMGGNAATQTLAIMVRGIAVGDITLRTSKPAIIREVLAGLINGVITGTLVALIAYLFGQTLLLGLVVGLAIVSGLVVAGFFGTIIPLFLKYIGKDPATSATIFITTATDVFGFFALLGLATLILL
ncbi:MAG: magnesium transporter [Candidatus Paceibacterota bacterium]